MTSLIGRDAELARMRAGLARAAGGDPGVIVVSGLPGMGKSRLAAEALSLARDAGFGTLLGHADESAAGIAYAPFIEALGPLLRDMPADERATLLRGLGQLSLLIGALDVRAPRQLRDPALERARIVDGFAVLVERLARRAPLAFMIDDGHALDRESAALLAHLALTIDDRALLFVLTTRSDEPHGTRARQLVAGMSSATWWHDRVQLDPLPPAHAATLLDNALGARADPELARLVLDECGGVPLFIESIAEDLLEGGRLTRCGQSVSLAGSAPPLPADLRSRIALRLAALTADDRRVIELIALSGSYSEYSVLAAVGIPEEQLDAALERFEKRMLAVSADDGTITLAHGILQQVVIDELAPARRRRRHSELARALRARDAGDPRIVEHLMRAGSLIDPALALGALREAAARAGSLGATDDAVRYLRAALELSQAAPAPRSAQADVLVELGIACVTAGRRGEAADHWRRALENYRRRGDANGVAHVHRELALLAWGDGDAAVASEHFEKAERAQEGQEPSREHAELLYTRMTVAVRDGDTGTVAQLADRLRPIAARLGSTELSIRLLLVEAAHDIAEKRLDAAVDKNTRALDLARAADEPALMMRAYDQRSVAASIRGDLSELRRDSEASLDMSQELGAMSMQFWPRMRLSLADLLGGEWDRALRTSADVLATVDRFGEQRGRLSALGTHAWLLVVRGRLAEAADTLARARPLFEHGDGARGYADRRQLSTAMTTASTALALAQGDDEEAARVGAPLADLTASWYPFAPAMLLGEALARTAPTRAAELSERIRDWNTIGTPFPNAVASFIDGTCETSPAVAADAFATAAGGFDSLGFPFLAARARIERADRLRAEAGDTATDLAAEALTVFERLGAPRHAQRARQVLRALGVVPSRGRAAMATGVLLSPRELEVSRLVASGSSNAQIATALFISPRTVTTHLDRIYQRLGLNSRAALTRYLADSGLLDSAIDEAIT
ncbi:AAA family ATPase [Microbacterium sp. STN6]|uniref:helix-turn-helix transcriptional regulator n=1 Tax=Microbacterium sp. STN6 TaxID=2995588 RepID=UPI002260FE0F|nr:LuxR family transcriptional regulator [Microbacterium sp. STN6]MCX7521930.1 AAA family ATPase [Microbacterium sp. STN6]